MKLGVRAKLFAVSVSLVLAAVIAAGIALENELRERLETNILREIERHARSARALIAESDTSDAVAEVDAIADRLGRATEMRVTFISPVGTVLGDSELSPAEVATVENHDDRPEVVEARTGGLGRARRYSTTLETDMQYVAIQAGSARPGWVIRVAKPLSEVDAAIARLRRQIAAAGLIGLLAAVLMSALVAHWMARTLRSLAENARAIARGAPHRRVTVGSFDEIGKLAGSLNEMAEGIEGTVRALAEERGRIRTVLEAMSDAVIALDDTRHVTLINPAALELLGLTESPVGRPLIEVVRAPALHELIADHSGASGTAEFDWPVGHRRVLARVTSQRGSPGCVIVVSDISALRRLEAVRRDFVANVSHELRTPVSVVQANAETLLDGALEDPAAARTLIEALHRNAERMARLIGDLLDLSRIEAGRYEVGRERVSIATAARRAVEAVAGAAQDKGIAVQLDAPLEVVASADAKALDQVLVNLLDNAVKYLPDGGHVRVEARASGDTVRIEVSDDGPGIPASERERVFERFYRIDPGRSRDMGGTGLGLSIVKHLVERMNGRIGVGEAVPHGAVFWVELPRSA